MILFIAAVWLFLAGFILRQLSIAWRARQFGAVAVCVAMAGILAFCLVAMVSVL